MSRRPRILLRTHTEHGRIIRIDFATPSPGVRSMPKDRYANDRWRRQRLIDILSVIAVLALIFCGYRYFDRSDAPTKTSFIVPSQNVHW
jgi:hypothetical protein